MDQSFYNDFFASCLQFSQNESKKHELLATVGTTLVHADPYDILLGVGIHMNDRDVCHKERWKGENILGQVLTEIRDEFLSEIPVIWVIYYCINYWFCWYNVSKPLLVFVVWCNTLVVGLVAYATATHNLFRIICWIPTALERQLWCTCSYCVTLQCCFLRCSGLSSVLWPCRKGIRFVKNWVLGHWHGYLSAAWCKWFAYGPAVATATRSSLAPVNPEWFTFLVLAYPGCPGKKPLNGCSSSSICSYSVERVPVKLLSLAAIVDASSVLSFRVWQDSMECCCWIQLHKWLYRLYILLLLLLLVQHYTNDARLQVEHYTNDARLQVEHSNMLSRGWRVITRA